MKNVQVSTSKGAPERLKRKCLEDMLLKRPRLREEGGRLPELWPGSLYFSPHSTQHTESRFSCQIHLWGEAVRKPAR
ncbi:hypothetical protein UFOVP255_40 [uncultured Caudovirales phage]|uniref:Uncharacterized protein n=1 Tax=uncultured Caudovirales phage TaxID=2100421 RepID=A0A6J5LHV4_9CAUD|nr:hypothetical protein UFOVP255_40 [uncultured Caudovirales phage]